jgi:hypothetical protein
MVMGIDRALGRGTLGRAKGINLKFFRDLYVLSFKMLRQDQRQSIEFFRNLIGRLPVTDTALPPPATADD